MNITSIKIESELKQSENLWVPAGQFISTPRRRYWLYVPSFPKGPVVSALGAKKPGATFMKVRGVKYEVTHTWAGLTKPWYDPEGKQL